MHQFPNANSQDTAGRPNGKKAHGPCPDRGLPDVESPAVQGIYGQPDSAWEMVNRYGTYEIQPTCDTDNLYPMIMQGLPRQWQSALERKRTEWKHTPPMQ